MLYRRILFILALIVIPFGLIAQTAKTVVPDEVPVHENFKIQYTINSHDAELKTPLNLSDDFEIISGPNRSVYSSYGMVNGKTISENSLTITYILSVNREGTFIIPGATFSVGGKTIKSKQATVRAVGQRHNYSSGRGASSQSSGGNQGSTSGSKVQESDLIISVSANKTTVYEQEPIVLTYKVHTRLSLDYLQNNAPEFKGFMTQEVELPYNKTFTTDEINGKTYRSTTWSQYVLFPQQSGKMTVPPVMFEGSIERQVDNIDPIDAFFNGGMSYSIPIKRRSKPLDIEVLPLPANKPANFSGGVGRYTMKTEVVTKDVKTNEPLTIKVTIEGTGNLKLIKAPEIKYPTDFDTYDTQTNENSSLSSQGMTGSIAFEYLAVPKSMGKFTIPPIEFSYFDSETKSYRTIKSEAIKLNVGKGSNDGSGVSELLKQRNADIKDIKTALASDTNTINLSAYAITYAALLIVFAAILLLLKKQIRHRSDLTGRNARQAGKKARSILANAQKCIAGGDAEGFYTELENALSGFIADKLRLKETIVSAGNAKELLEKSGLDTSISSRAVALLDKCQMAKFAGVNTEATHTDLEEATSVITEINDRIK